MRRKPPLDFCVQRAKSPIDRIAYWAIANGHVRLWRVLRPGGVLKGRMRRFWMNLGDSAVSPPVPVAAKYAKKF